MKPRLVLHIGAPKTGTTYLQTLMWTNKTYLAERGVFLPGDRQRFHFRAGADLHGPGLERTRGPKTAGAWKKYVKRARRSSAPTVFLSDERLAGAPAEAARKVAELSDDREVHVVYAARNLVSLMPSSWQNQVRHGMTLRFVDWATRVLASQPGEELPPGFWLRHDAAHVYSRWREAVADPDHFHFITVPPSRDNPNLLWERFAEAADLPRSMPVMEAPRTNLTLDYAQAEFMRRVNVALGEDLGHDAYRKLMRNLLSNRVMAPLSRRDGPRVPPRMHEAIETRAGEIIEFLRTTQCDVVGDLADLDPKLGPKHVPPSKDELLSASVESMAQLIRELASGRPF